MPTLEELEDEERRLYQGSTASARAAAAPAPLPEADPPLIGDGDDGAKEDDPKPDAA